MNCGMIAAARIPMPAHTTFVSISVNPFNRLCRPVRVAQSFTLLYRGVSLCGCQGCWKEERPRLPMEPWRPCRVEPCDTAERSSALQLWDGLAGDPTETLVSRSSFILSFCPLRFIRIG